ncbi:MAG TPA: LCP family protein [Micromonosporaceae bacterium]|nr:LCP family protein [Micromonosporaceae bacterium]
MGALLMMASGGSIVGSKVLIGHATSNIEQTNLLGDAGKTAEEGGGDLKGSINLLLLGVDARERNAGQGVRSDTIIILHIPATHDQAYLLSVPRDTEVDVPGHGKRKVTEAFFFGERNGGGWAGGAQLMSQTLNRATGIKFDGAAIINFGGFKRIIDALGGIHVCVEHEVKSMHMKLVNGKPMWNHEAKKVGGKQETVVHKKGCREMQGWEALDYSRQRYGLPGTDYGRQQNQQKIIKAIAKKAMAEGLTNPVKLNGLLKAMGDALVVDTNGVPIEDFIFTLRGVAANELVLLQTNGGKYHGVKVGNESRERLDERSRAMFKAVKNDALAEFITEEPSVVVPSK